MLDIEMAAAGAPAYGGTNGATIYVVEISPSSSTLDDGFNAMASANYSVGTCSYGITGTGTYPDGDSTAHTIFLEMAAQGMTMCNATGDSAAVCWTNTSSKYYNPAYVPTGDPYVLQFGATTLTTTGSGSSIGYGSEQIWMYSTTVGSETGSTGGYSMTYTNLPYQKTNGINYTVNGGSSTMRNFPDLVLVGDDVQVNVTSSQTNVVMGSSCAAPFGAGLIASINQESLQNTGSRLGFMNPTLYALALGPKGSRYFRQNISGNNVWGGSIGYYTVNGTYDFAKGLGSLYNFNMVVPPPTPIGLRIVPVGH
jgi:subtilase family serine protease